MIAVTGATGELGSRVARRLAARGVAQRLIVRDPARAPALEGASVAVAPGGYADVAGLTEALRGASTLLLVSAAEDADRQALHRNAVHAAVAAGVGRIVYTSFVGAAADATFTFVRDHHAAEQHIRSTGLAFTFMRNSLYLDFVPMFGGRDGVIRGPAGDGRVAPVARDDSAASLAAVLAAEDGAHTGATYSLTGPEAHTLSWFAEQLSELTGRSFTFVNETVEEAYASRASYGAPRFEVDGWVTSYTAIAAGEFDVVSGDVERLTGEPPLGLREFLAAHPDALAV